MGLYVKAKTSLIIDSDSLIRCRVFAVISMLFRSVYRVFAIFLSYSIISSLYILPKYDISVEKQDV